MTTATINIPYFFFEKYNGERSKQIYKGIEVLLKSLKLHFDIPRKLFVTRTGFIRIGLLLMELIELNENLKDLKDFLSTSHQSRFFKVIEIMKENPNGEHKPKRKLKKPKKLINLYPRDINKSLVISFLNEVSEPITADRLTEISGIHTSMIYTETRLIQKQYPNLIKSSKVGKKKHYLLDKDELQRLLNSKEGLK